MLLLHQLIEATVERLPGAPAVCTDDAALTYAQLDAAARRIAGNLVRRHRIGVGSLVAIALPPSLSLIATVYGVLKTGAGYLPVDPAAPGERERFILEDSEANLVVAERAELSTFHSDGRPATAVGALLATGPDIPTRGAAASPKDLAYVIYTSGSTGRPKGVAVEHRHIVASTLARRDHYPRAPETYAMLFPPAFDGAVGVIYWTLMAGGCLYLPPPITTSRVSGLLWAGGIGRPVTDICCVPSLYQVILENAEQEDLAGLRRVIVAAEACRPSLVRQHLDLAPQASLHNEYGPTEAAVWSTVFDCTAPVSGRVPIGRPISSATVDVVDDRLCPVPDGRVGELVIGGAGVARGYVNAPQLTAERFLPDPALPDRRRYRTGDLVRRRADGHLEFLGRSDDQIKWNGYRIEPGEIEESLGSLPGVVEVAVVVNTSVASSPALVAFLRSTAAVDREALAAHLAQSLPAFMLPSDFVTLPSFPRNANGKVDRAALGRQAIPARSRLAPDG